ncbi:uncharacterized protein [Periplaneta americana]|uniref:uncharacterized protein n=1 Tax=Periplaneta americana TaxID=6978 RepID=UPI0037E9AFBD
MSGREGKCKDCSCKSTTGRIRIPGRSPHRDNSSQAESSLGHDESHAGPTRIDRGSNVCLIDPTTKDLEICRSKQSSARRVWIMSRPPYGFSHTSPTVTARRAQVTRAQLLGQLKRIPMQTIPSPPIISYGKAAKASKRPSTSIIFKASAAEKKKDFSKFTFK